MSEKTLYTWLIYFILPALYGPGRSLLEPLMVLTELYASSHPLWHLPWNSWCSRDAGISNDDSQHRVGAQAVNRCAQVGTTWPPWQWQRGRCTTPTNTPTCQWFIEEFTQSQGEMCWSAILLKWHLLHYPIVVWLWYKIIPHLIHCNKTGSCSKLHTHLKRELSHETRLAETIPTTKHMLVTQSHVSVTQFSYKKWPKWLHLQVLLVVKHGQMQYCKFRWSFPHGLVWWSFGVRGNRSTVRHSGYWLTAPRRILHIPLHKHIFPNTERVALHRQVFLGFPVSKSKCWDGSQDSKLLLHASHVALQT